ncbi:MAG: DNA polymerase III subunit gamma/tau [Candidatus Peribacteraceae bacterium]
MTLYLKYRPQSFADVVGQDHVVTTLEQAIQCDRISHAYLLCGTRGTGKTSVARILAKIILTKGIADEALKQQLAKAVETGSLVDLVEIDAASHTGVDDVRDLIEKMQFTPAMSGAKVYIIDEVHMLSKSAFNALLKTLEEPPEYVYFIFATTELHKVPDTIQSRCQRFLFRRVRDDDILRRLQYIADQEHIKIDREALRTIARHALGSFRDGIALLDQLRSLEKITLADVTERIGKSSLTFMEEIVRAMTERNMTEITNVVRRIEESNVSADLIATDLLSLIRTHMHQAIERQEDPAPYLRMTETILGALKNIRISPVPALALEAALLSLCTEPTQTPKLQQRSSPLPKLVVPQDPGGTAEEEKPASSPPVEQAKTALVEAEELTVDSILRHWDDILQGVHPPSVRMSLKTSTVSGIDDNTVRLTFSSAFNRDKVAETKASRTIEEVLASIYKRPARIKCVLEKDMKMTNLGPATDLVEAAAEVFGSL